MYLIIVRLMLEIGIAHEGYTIDGWLELEFSERKSMSTWKSPTTEYGMVSIPYRVFTTHGNEWHTVGEMMPP